MKRLLLLKSTRTVNVKGYTRKDGTFVKPHQATRAVALPQEKERLYAGTSRDAAKKIFSFGELFDHSPASENYFGGIFSSQSLEVAQSHGSVIQALDIPSDRIMSHDDLRDQLLYQDGAVEEIKSMVDDLLNERITTDEAYELAEHMGGDKSIYDDDPEMGIDRMRDILGRWLSEGEMDWKIQGLAGEFARRKGYAAVELPDEHGMSILVLNHPDVEIHVVPSDGES